MAEKLIDAYDTCFYAYYGEFPSDGTLYYQQAYDALTGIYAAEKDVYRYF